MTLPSATLILVEEGRSVSAKNILADEHIWTVAPESTIHEPCDALDNDATDTICSKGNRRRYSKRKDKGDKIIKYLFWKEKTALLPKSVTVEATRGKVETILAASAQSGVILRRGIAPETRVNMVSNNNRVAMLIKWNFEKWPEAAAEFLVRGQEKSDCDWFKFSKRV